MAARANRAARFESVPVGSGVPSIPHQPEGRRSLPELDGSGVLFLLDPWWNPAVEAQAIDRAHRSVNHVRVAYRLLPGPRRGKGAELQQTKRELAERF